MKAEGYTIISNPITPFASTEIGRLSALHNSDSNDDAQLIHSHGILDTTRHIAGKAGPGLEVGWGKTGIGSGAESGGDVPGHGHTWIRVPLSVFSRVFSCRPDGADVFGPIANRTFNKPIQRIAEKYAQWCGYRQHGLKYDDLIIEESETVQKVGGEQCIRAIARIHCGQCIRATARIHGCGLC